MGCLAKLTSARVGTLSLLAIATMLAAPPLVVADTPTESQVATLWDDAFLAGDDLRSSRLHGERLQNNAYPTIPGLSAEDSAATWKELELLFFRERTGSTNDYPYARKVLERFLEHPHSPWITALAHSHLGYYCWRLGDLPSAHEHWAHLSTVNEWWVIGSFENERGSGMGTPYPPEREIAFDATYPGKRSNVSWRLWSEAGRAGLLELDQMLRPAEESLCYLVTHLYVEDETAAVLRVDTTGSYHLHLNDQLLRIVDVERPLRFDQDATPAILHRGWNRLLLKSGNTKGTWWTRVRVTDPQGAPVAFEVSAELPADAVLEPDDPAAAPPDSSSSVHRGASSHLERATDSAFVQTCQAWLIGERHSHDLSQHPDRERLQHALQADPNNILASYLMADTYRRRVTHTAEREENEWRRLLEHTLEVAPHFHRVRLELASYYLDRFGNLTRAERLWQPAFDSVTLEKWPSSWLRHKASLVSRRHNEAAAEIWWQRVRERATGNEPLLDVRAVNARRALSRGNLVAAKSIVAGARLFDRVDNDLATLDQDLCVRAGDVEGARAVLAEMAEIYPFSIRRRQLCAQFESSRENWKDAVTLLQEAVAISPDDAETHRLCGEQLLFSESTGAALVSFQRSLSLDPNQPRLREWVQSMGAENSELVQRFRVDTEDTIATALAATEDDDLPARILLDATSVKLNLDGTQKRYRQFLVKILNDRGARQFTAFPVPYASGEQWVQVLLARVHNKDGRVEEARIRNRAPQRRGGEYPVWSQAWIDLPPVQPGAVVEIEYRLEDLRQSFFGDYFGDQVTFADSNPRDLTIYNLLAPKGRDIYFHQRHLEVQPTVAVAADERQWRWEVGPVAAIESEPGMPPLEELVPTLSVSTFKDWEEFGRWYAHLIRKQFESSAQLETKVQELVAGAETTVDKVRALYNFVVTDIRYIAWEFGVHGFKPYKASTIFARRFGDCKDKATLLCTMLDQIGVDAYPVLIEASRQRPLEDLTLPLINHFNHCIVYIPDRGDGQGCFVDGTAEHHSFDELPMSDRGAKVLVVEEDRGELAEIPWNKPEEQRLIETTHIQIDPKGAATVEQSNQFHGDYAVGVRSGFEIEGKRRDQVEQLFGQRFPGTRVVQVETSDLGDLNQEVEMNIELQIPDYVDLSSGKVTLPPVRDLFGTTRGLRSTASDTEREHDLLLGNPALSKLTWRIELPRGFRPEQLPDTVSLDNPLAKFELSSTVTGNTLTITRTLELKTPRVAAADYPQFKEFVDLMERAREQRITLEKAKLVP